MATMPSYDVGDLVEVYAIFRNPKNADALFDPSEVHLQVRDPQGNVQTYTYDGDDENDSEDGRIYRSEAGKYHFNVDVGHQSGVWYYRWYSKGTGQAADEEPFRVAVAYATTTSTTAAP